MCGQKSLSSYTVFFTVPLTVLFLSFAFLSSLPSLSLNLIKVRIEFLALFDLRVTV